MAWASSSLSLIQPPSGPSILFLTDDTQIAIKDVGAFAMGGMSQAQFKKLFRTKRFVDVVEVSCAKKEERAACVKLLLIDPKTKGNGAKPGTVPVSTGPTTTGGD